MGIPKIITNRLLLVDGLVWVSAGCSVASIGIGSFAQYAESACLPIAAIAVFLFFFFGVFLRIVKKNEKRIRSYTEERTSVFKFLDTKGYIIMIVMIGLGATLRFFGTIPAWFFAFFYTGLGLALLIAGVVFIINYSKNPRLRLT